MIREQIGVIHAALREDLNSVIKDISYM